MPGREFLNPPLKEFRQRFRPRRVGLAEVFDHVAGECPVPAVPAEVIAFGRAVLDAPAELREQRHRGGRAGAFHLLEVSEAAVVEARVADHVDHHRPQPLCPLVQLRRLLGKQARARSGSDPSDAARVTLFA
jgi:hypothetical protein